MMTCVHKNPIMTLVNNTTHCPDAHQSVHIQENQA